MILWAPALLHHVIDSWKKQNMREVSVSHLIFFLNAKNRNNYRIIKESCQIQPLKIVRNDGPGIYLPY